MHGSTAYIYYPAMPGTNKKLETTWAGYVGELLSLPNNKLECDWDSDHNLSELSELKLLHRSDRILQVAVHTTIILVSTNHLLTSSRRTVGDHRKPDLI